MERTDGGHGEREPHCGGAEVNTAMQKLPVACIYVYVYMHMWQLVWVDVHHLDCSVPTTEYEI